MNVRCVTNMVGENRFGKFMFAQSVSRCRPHLHSDLGLSLCSTVSSLEQVF